MRSNNLSKTQKDLLNINVNKTNPFDNPKLENTLSNLSVSGEGQDVYLESNALSQGIGIERFVYKTNKLNIDDVIAIDGHGNVGSGYQKTLDSTGESKNYHVTIERDPKEIPLPEDYVRFKPLVTTEHSDVYLQNFDCPNIKTTNNIFGRAIENFTKYLGFGGVKETIDTKVEDPQISVNYMRTEKAGTELVHLFKVTAHVCERNADTYELEIPFEVTWGNFTG